MVLTVYKVYIDDATGVTLAYFTSSSKMVIIAP